MHVAMLSDFELVGGAAIAASRLAEGLCENGHKVTRIVRVSNCQNQLWERRVLSIPFIRPSLRKVFPDLFWKLVIERTYKSFLKKTLKLLNPDVINIHNIHGAIKFGWSLGLVEVCLGHAPTVWTLHDMWSFTGRCAYSKQCQKFRTGCDENCPSSDEYPSLQQESISDAWEQRRSLLGTSNLAAATPSSWLAEQARKGLWREYRVEIIPNGLPLDRYPILDRSTARAKLALNRTGPVVLVVAPDLTDRRKGVELLIEALNEAWCPPLTLLTMGRGGIRGIGNNIIVRRLGYIADQHTKLLAYNSADAFIHPALSDNLPNVALEAIACGTPIIAFRIGGMPEIVREGKTGWLVEPTCANALANTIDRALRQIRDGLDLRESCRAMAEAEYSQDLQAKRYISLFRSML